VFIGTQEASRIAFLFRSARSSEGHQTVSVRNLASTDTGRYGIEMSTNTPKGFLVLSLYLLGCGVYSIKHLFFPINDWILLNTVLKGFEFYLMNSLYAILGISIGTGLLFKKKWAYMLFMVSQVGFIILFIGNILVIENQTLMEAGWKNIERLETLTVYKVLSVLMIIFQVILMLWAKKYKALFFEKKN